MLYTLSKVALLPREVCFTAVSIPKGCGAGTGSFLVSGSSAELLGWKVSPLPRLSLARFSHTTTFPAVLTMSGLVNRFVTVPDAVVRVLVDSSGVPVHAYSATSPCATVRCHRSPRLNPSAGGVGGVLDQ